MRWLKEVGDPVGQGEILAEIEADKATMELVARGEGLLRRILVAAGGTVPVGEVIAIIAAEGEEIESAPDEGPAGSEATVERAAGSSHREDEAESGGSGRRRGRGAPGRLRWRGCASQPHANHDDLRSPRHRRRLGSPIPSPKFCPEAA